MSTMTVNDFNYSSNTKVTQALPSNFKSDAISVYLSSYANPDLFEKIINVTLYNGDINLLITKKENILSTYKKFFDFCYDKFDLYKNALTIPVELIKKIIKFGKQLIKFKREVGNKLINYDNVEIHFPNISLEISNIINNIKKNRIETSEQYNEETNYTLNIIKHALIIAELEPNLLQFESMNLQFKTGNGIAPIQLFDNYVNFFIDSYTRVCQIKNRINISDNGDQNNIIIGDQKSIRAQSKLLLDYLSINNATYKSGLKIIDDTIGGFPCASLTIICGPSNNGKSLLLINILYQVLLNNTGFNKNSDVILFYTLEDSYVMLMKRIITVLGNYNSLTVRQTYEKISDLSNKSKEEGGNIYSNKTYNELLDLLNNTLVNTYYDLINHSGLMLDIKEGSTGQVSVSEMNRYIDGLKAQGKNVKMIICDYIDHMIPSDGKYNPNDDYNNHGLKLDRLYRNV